MREAKKRKEITEEVQREREKLMEKKESLAKNEERLNEKEEKARQELQVADELFEDATSKLNNALASKPLDPTKVAAAKTMLEAANTKRQKAMENLDEVRRKQKSLDKSTHQLLEKALSSKEQSQEKRKSETGGKSSMKKLKK